MRVFCANDELKWVHVEMVMTRLISKICGEAKDRNVDQGFEDTVLLEDAFATQVMNFGCETQVVNLGGEMQTLDNLDCFENIGTQWLDEDCETEVVIGTDGGGTTVTKALGRTRELSDDDSVNRVCGKPVDQEKFLYTESLLRGFASIRVASLRASGLAARGMAFKGINTSDSQSLKQLNAKHEELCVAGDPPKFVEEIDQEHTLGKYDEQMKRLTKDNTLDEINGHNKNKNSADVEAEQPILFLKDNVTEFDLEVDIRKSIEGKSKPVSIAKGAQT
ncbi:hypothetical protein LguiA_031155 [Lonicera macranthoides]